MNAPTFFRRVGGRKQFNGYIGAVLLTIMAVVLGASFPEYAGALLLVLGFTTGAVMGEDHLKRKVESS